MNSELKKYEELIRNYAENSYRRMFREPLGALKYPFIVPGVAYARELWDWDSWLTNIALVSIAKEDISDYERGCVLNFLEDMDPDGRMSIDITPEGRIPLFESMKNIHKPCIAQHALFISEHLDDFEWIRPYYERLELFISYYRKNCLHESGLYFWLDDGAIGVDNEPCTFYRPHGSSASIYLNCLMYKELEAMSSLAEKLGLPDAQKRYSELKDELLLAVRENCWDERDGFYYTFDINLLPVDPNELLHSGAPRTWTGLIMRIGVWTGFMAMWAGIATPEQAKRMVEEHYKCDKTFHSPYGIRSLSKMEKMYTVKPSGNPSCWLGPIWGIANYMTFRGLVDYGFIDEARELAENTVRLFGHDLEENGDIHEYYSPETGKGVHNIGFQSWNLLVVNMLDWLKDN